MKTLTTSSSASTKALGRKMAERISNFQFPISNEKSKHAFVIALSGDLGVGKTTFVQGFFKGLGIKRRAVSPTFIIFRRYAIRHLLFANLYHVDAYRIKNPKDLAVLEFDKILADPKNIVLIEWADNIKKILPKGALWIYFKHGEKENERKISLSSNMARQIGKG